MKSNFSASLKSSFVFIEGDLVDFSSLTSLFQQHKPSHVVNLAAQAGVRYSIENPYFPRKHSLSFIGKSWFPEEKHMF